MLCFIPRFTESSTETEKMLVCAHTFAYIRRVRFTRLLASPGLVWLCLCLWISFPFSFPLAHDAVCAHTVCAGCVPNIAHNQSHPTKHTYYRTYIWCRRCVCVCAPWNENPSIRLRARRRKTIRNSVDRIKSNTSVRRVRVVFRFRRVRYNTAIFGREISNKHILPYSLPKD